MPIPLLPPVPFRSQPKGIFAPAAGDFLAGLNPWGIAANALAEEMNAAAATVGAVSAELAIVAAISEEVGTVAGISADVVAVHGISGEVETVAAVAGAVSTLAPIAEDIESCAFNMAAILAAPDHASDASASAALAGDHAENAALSLSSAQEIEAVLTAIAAGGNIYLTKAALTASAGSIDANGFGLVVMDESNSNHATLYQKQSGVMVSVLDLTTGVPPSWGDIVGNLADQADLHAALAAKAPLSSPAFVDTPTAPTAAPGTNTTQLATTAFVLAAIAAIIDSSPESLNTLNELAAALGDDPYFATTVLNALAAKASLTGAETLTNKRITRRIVTAGATSGNLTPNSDTTDRFKATGLTGATTFLDPTGTPTDQQQLVVFAKDNGTSRTISWGASYAAAKNLTLPVGTTANKWFKACFEWSSDDSKWVMVALVEQA